MSAYKTTSPLRCLPSAANGVTVTPPGIAEGWSSWVQLSASASSDMRVATIVAFPGTRAIGNWYEVELGVGAALSEVAVAATRGLSGTGNGGNSDASDLIHLAIPADVVQTGDRLAVRVRQTSTDTTPWKVSIQYWALPMNGTVPGASVGPVNVPSGSRFTVTSGSANVYGSWVEIDASIDDPWTIGNVVCFGPQPDVTSYSWELEIGIGTTGSWTPTWSVKSYVVWFSAFSSFQGGPWNVLLRPALGPIPVGSSVALRMRSPQGSAAFNVGLTVTKQAVAGASSNLRMLWTDGVDIPSVAGGQTNFTDWTEVIAETATEIALSGVTKLYELGGHTGHVIVQIGVGAEDEEALVSEHYLNSAVWSGGRSNFPLPYARLVPAGSRVVVRYSQEDTGASVNNSFALSYQEILTTPDFDNYTDELIQRAYFNPLQYYWTLTTGASAWADGAWVEVDADVPINRVITAFEWVGPEYEVEVDLGIGASGSETVASTIRWSGSLSEGGPAFHDVLPAPQVLPRGERFAIRARCANTDATVVQFTPHYTAEPGDTPPAPPQPIPGGTVYRIRRERISPTVFSDGKRVLHRRLQLDCEPGIGNANDPGAVPTLLVYTSDDGGHTWQGPREMFPGEIGQYLKQMKLYQLGSAYNRVYKVVCDSPNQWVIAQAFLDIDGASS